MIKLKEIRKMRKMTQVEVARKLNISQSAYNYYENGVSDLNTQAILKLSDLFGVTTDELLGRKQINSIVVPEHKRETVIDLLSLSDRQFEKVQAYIAALVDSNEEIKNEVKKFID